MLPRSAIKTGWKSVSADSLRKYPVNFSLSEYNNIDVYCYSGQIG
jgi:hypothetical protein